MKEISVADILKATGGRLLCGSEESKIRGIKHDSRECGNEDMFVAVRGENQDGHSYLPKVLESGCRTVLISHSEGMEELMGDGVNFILVEDTVRAMGLIASWYIDMMGVRRVAVTGSVGKTSTRDMIYYVLSTEYNCGKNLKNYNNNIGLPLSIFTFDENTEVAVLEMGMDAFGEIDYLSGIVRPEIGVITNIGVAHMEKLGSREGIYRAKMEISGSLPSRERGGCLFFAGDGEFLTKERTAGDYETVEIGFGPSCDYIISNVDDFGIEGIKFNVAYGEEKVEVHLPVAGTHNAINGTIALAVGHRMGVGLRKGAEGLASAELTGSRLRKVEGRSITVIDDTYNANPDSMKSAIDVLGASRASRKVAILGDMFELGPEEKELHRGVGLHAAEKNIDRVITIGNLGRYISEGAGGEHFQTKEDFLKVAEEIILPNDLVLVKASRGMKMEEIVEKIKNI